jgi:hypothetical protein
MRPPSMSTRWPSPGRSAVVFGWHLATPSKKGGTYGHLLLDHRRRALHHFARGDLRDQVI